MSNNELIKGRLTTVGVAVAQLDRRGLEVVGVEVMSGAKPVVEIAAHPGCADLPGYAAVESSRAGERVASVEFCGCHVQWRLS